VRLAVTFDVTSDGPLSNVPAVAHISDNGPAQCRARLVAPTLPLQVKRKYLLEWERLEILEKLAKEGRRFVSGPAGQEMMREMTPVAFDFDKTKSKTFF